MNTRFQSFENFLTTQNSRIDILDFIVYIALAVLSSWLLQLLYIKCGQSVSNRRKFASNFILLSTTTMIVITVVKSSLALSLGLVGALSIVRFRAAIKEPEELSYLFLTIAIGLGMGAGQCLVTLIGFAVISAVIGLKYRFRTVGTNKNLILTLSSAGDDKIELKSVVNVLEKHCNTIALARLDESEHALEATFYVEFTDFDALESSRSELVTLSKGFQISYLDNRGLI